MKKIILFIIFSFILTGCSSQLGASLSTANQIKTEQENYFKTNGKYKQQTEKTVGNITQAMSEYTAPDRQKGYQVYETDKRADGVYIRSYGEGGEAKDRSYDWIKIGDYNTATSTTLK